MQVNRISPKHRNLIRNWGKIYPDFSNTAGAVCMGLAIVFMASRLRRTLVLYILPWRLPEMPLSGCSAQVH